MARIKIIRGTNLPNTASKTDCHNLVDDATAQIYDIVNSEVKSDAAIEDTKLATISTIGKVNLSALVCASAVAGDILYMNNAGSMVRLPIGTAGQKLRTANIQMDYFEYATNDLAKAGYVSSVLATGGTITVDGNDIVHTFTTDGTFTPLVAMDVKTLVVAGGGGGGCMPRGGAGGAGGLIYDTDFAVTAQAYPITVGGGGAKGVNAGDAGSQGGNSVFSTLTAVGGGYGAGTDWGNGGNGGSGGGAYYDGVYGNGTSAQGNNGGGSPSAGTSTGGGGGGGAGSAGGSGIAGVGGTAGAGLAYDIILSGTNVTYASGGTGAVYNSPTAPAAVAGGGGKGNNSTTATPATANTGGGGGSNGDGGSGIVVIRYTPALCAFSEATTKTQGSYALKAVALITSSLNKTLTKTVSPAIDLTGCNTLKFDIRSTRTGSNIKIGIHDSGGTTTEVTPNITSANAWQTITWDISGVSDANKNVIDSIIITIVNADAANTFYLDNFYIYDAINALEWVTP